MIFNNNVSAVKKVTRKICKSVFSHLMISPGVGQDQQPRLAKSILQLIGKSTRCMSPCNGLAACVLGELQDSSLSIRPCRLHNDVLWILNGDDHSGS